jgi:hypothetical protein
MNRTCRGWVRTVRARVGLVAGLAVSGLFGLGSGSAHALSVPVGAVLAGVAGQGDFGTIKGRLVWGGDQAPERKALREVGKADKDPAVCAANAPIPDNKLAVDPKTKGIKFGFAYLVRPKGENPAAVKALVEKAPKVVIDQKNCEFLPYSVGVHQDQTLVFKSSDPVNHNIHVTPFTNAPFNTILPPNGEMEKKFVAERRVVPLTCDIHPWMHGNIMVFDHPFFAVTGEDGSFEIKGVPPGEQNLVVWQEAVGYVTPGLARGMPVVVKAGEVSSVGEVVLAPSKVK